MAPPSSPTTCALSCSLASSTSRREATAMGLVVSTLVADPQIFPAAPDVHNPAPTNDLGAVLSPSQVRTFLGCPAKWWYKYALGLPDPPGASFVRGRVVHKVAEVYFRAKLHGAVPDADDLETP